MKMPKKQSVINIFLLQALLLAGCTAARHPPAIPSKAVTPEVPYLWPEEEGKKAEVKASDGEIPYNDGVDGGIGIDNGIIAIVNSRVITLKEFDFHFSQACEKKSPSEELYNQVLDSLVERTLFVEMAEKKEAEGRKDENKRSPESEYLAVSDSEIDKSLESLAVEFGGWEAYRSFLDENKQSLEEVKARIRESLISGKLERMLYAGIGVVSPQEILEEYKGREGKLFSPDMRDLSLIIVFSENYKDPAKAEEIMGKVFGQLRQGEDFSKLAENYSEGPRAKAGGRLGWVKKEDVHPKIWKTAESLSAGEQSGVASMEGGFLIAKCHGRRDAGPMSYEEVQVRLKNDILERRKKERKEEIMRDLMKNAHVRKLPAQYYLKHKGT